MNKILLLLILLVISCQSESPKEYPVHPEPGIWSPGSNQWVAHYQELGQFVPQPENPNVLLSRNGDLRIRFERLPDQSNLSVLRDQAFDQLSCREGVQHDAYINCEHGFQKSIQKYGRHQSLALMYFGNLQSSDSPNTQLFLELNGDSVKIEIEGDLHSYQGDFTKILDTLSFKLEAIDSQDTDQKGL